MFCIAPGTFFRRNTAICFVFSLQISTFKDYVDLYVGSTSGQSTNPVVAHKVINSRWEVAVAPSHEGFKQTSFVNSIHTERVGLTLYHTITTFNDPL